jgi:hypothetical protein
MFPRRERNGVRAIAVHLLVFVIALAVSGRTRAQGQTLEDYSAADPSAPEVTRVNLLQSERFWPYQIQLTQAWHPEASERVLPARTMGVLIAVQSPDVARIDFGREGLFEVPVAQTDLLQRANRVRQGDLHKVAPNFIHAIGPRLVDSAAPSLRPFDLRRAMQYEMFLAIFVDPESEQFAALATALSPLLDRPRLMVILFPQGRHGDPEIRAKLRTLKWEVPFVFDHLSESYTETLLPPDTPPPALLLQTSEGRVLNLKQWRAAASSEIVADLVSAIDAATAGSAIAATTEH